MEAGKSRPLGPPFQCETRLAKFPTGKVDPSSEILQLSLNINVQFFSDIYHQILIVYIEDIYFFEVNTKYISSSAVKKSVFFTSA